MDERELDYENYKFVRNQDVDSLIDVLSSNFFPDLVSELLEGAFSIQECITFGNEYRYETKELSE
jgi:hypothetical protein